MQDIEKWYDEKYEEWDRLDRHKVEFDITKRYLDEYIKGSNLKIFDIGGGPGRYSIYLSKKGHRVSLLDLSNKNIEVAREKTKALNIELDAYIHGNALELDTYKQEYDVILLMGPLYHLISEEDRIKCVEGALKLLKPQGIIVSSFISNYAPLQDNLKVLFPIDNPESILKYIDTGASTDPATFTTAYFSSWKESLDLMGSFNLKKLAFVGVENILSSKEIEVNNLSEESYRNWLDVCYELSQDENLYGTSEHYLYIGQKV